MSAVRPNPEITPIAQEPSAFERQYHQALAAYLEQADEDSLTQAYELGRDALERGRSIPDIVGTHGRVLQLLLAAGAARYDGDLVELAAAFLAETLAPFEMTHRGYRDSLVAWRHINETLEAEIKRIAHTLHDESSQLLVSVYLQVARLGREFPLAERRVLECQTLLNEVEQQLRRLSHDLRPRVLDDLGWLAALEFLAAAVSRRALVPIEVCSSVAHRLPAEVETALYRVVQEALTNAVRHARAGRIRIEIDQEQDSLRGVISDDGVGFEVEACVRHGGLGLRGMRERISALGGTLDVTSAPGRGARIRFKLPMG